MKQLILQMIFVAAIAAPLVAQPPKPDEYMARRRTAVVEVFEKSKDAIVNISTTQIIEYRAPVGLGGMLFDLFDMPGERVKRYKATSVGSGFVIHEDGYVVTNAHVVAKTAERKVIFSDEREYDAQIVAIDTERDMAILKIEGNKPFKTLPFGRSNDLMIGETVVAIGNPLSYQHSVTVGVISALDRDLDVSDQVVFKGLIQTDTSINPGNSGGPLLNVWGELIGVNTAIRADAQNIGFAIPVDSLREALPELLHVERRYRIHVGMKLSPGEKATVLGVEDNSPAAKAGVQVGDILIELNGKEINSGMAYHLSLLGKKPGDIVDVKVLRNSRVGTGRITLGERPKPDGGKLLHLAFGITAETITPEMARKAGLPKLRGLVITDVQRQSQAARGGMRRGDIIDHIGRYQVATLDDAGQLLEQAKSGQSAVVSILRIRGNSMYRTQVGLTVQ